MYDLIIIGSGPAGMAAAIYARRARLDFIVIEREAMGGGQVINTGEVDNYPGLPGVNGFDLASKMQDHAKGLGAEFVCDTVTELRDTEQAVKTVVCRKHTYTARTLILACGATHRKLGVPGEERLSGLGVSYCAVCDGAFYRGQTVAVVGGGDVAVEDAEFLSRICGRVFLIHRRDELRAAASLQEQLRSRENVEFLWNTVVKEIRGKNGVEEILLERRDGSGGEASESVLSVDGVFVAVGILPNTDFLEGIENDAGGYIAADETGTTSCPGVFAAGDIRTKPLRQIVTAVADGANAVASAERYLAARRV